MALMRTMLGSLAVLLLFGWAHGQAARTSADPQPPEAPAVRDGPYVGQFLVATPKMADPRFTKAVVLMLEHRVGSLADDTVGGAMGLIINRQIGSGPLGMLLRGTGVSVDKDLRDFQVTLHYGGPVEGYLAFILHSDDYRGGRNARPVRGMAHGQVVLSTDATVMTRVARGEGPRHSLFILGYTGWGPGQLEREIGDGAWVLVPADADLVFGADRGEALWRKTWALRELDL